MGWRNVNAKEERVSCLETMTYRNMKMRVAIAVFTTLAAFGQLKSRADDLFQMFWRGTYYKNDGSGHITAVNFSEQDFVNTVAQNNNLNPNQLVFVYRPNKHDTAVVFASNGAFVADVIQMAYNHTDVVNPTGRVIVRHALLYDEAHQVPLGSFFGLEMRTPNSTGGVSSDQLVGTVLYSKPDQDTVYGAQVSTGRRINDTS